MKDTIIQVLLSGGIVVLRTDTVYGVITRANDEKAVEKLYDLKHRGSEKPFITLIADIDQAYGDHAVLKTYSEQYSDKPTSIIIEAPDAPQYLLRGGTSIAYRLERTGILHDIIMQTGPLVAPSANPEGFATARTIDEAKQYFADHVDLYVDGGEVPETTQPSRLVRISSDGSVDTLR